jgi:hypothetical protein
MAAAAPAVEYPRRLNYREFARRDPDEAAGDPAKDEKTE